MTELNILDICVERFAELNQEELDVHRFEAFYAKCIKLPIIYLEEALKRHKEESRNLENNLIPTLMFDEGRRSVETMDGVSVKIKQEINASMKGADINLVAAWLDEKGYGAIVKRKHYLDDAELTDDQLQHLREDGVNLYADMEVNTNTLKKVLKEHYEKTEELPTDLMNVSIFYHAIIKFAKEDANE